jgi:hypothetical protein
MAEYVCFFGYGQLGKWMEVVDKSQPVYAMLVVESTPKQYRRVDRVFINCAQPQGGEMHYCRFLVGITEWINDECLNPDGERRKELERQAWDLVRVWLTDCGVQVREATPAYPKDYVFMEGSAVGVLGYDSVRGYFLEKDGKL